MIIKGLMVARLVLVMLCAPGLTSVAFAQANPRQDARMRFGILYATPSLSIDRLGYDDNVLNSAGEQKADFTASITPRSTLWIPFQNRALLTTDLGVGFVYYETFKSQRSVTPRIDALAEVYAHRLTFSVEAGASRDVRQPNVEVESRVKQTARTMGAGVRFTMQRGLSFGLSGYRRTTRFADDAVFSGVNLSDALDRSEQGVRLVVQERLTSLTTVGVIVETRQDRFDGSSARNADGYRAAMSIDLAAKALISGSAEIGYRHVSPDDPLVPAFDGLVAKVAVSNRLYGSTEIGLGWDRDTQYSANLSTPYFVTNAISARLRRQVAGQFDASAGAARNRATYRALLTGFSNDKERESTRTYTFDIGYRPSRDSRVALGVTRTIRSSTLGDARRYSNTFAGLSLNYVF